MKIRGEITAVECNGEAMKLTMQGKESGAAGWRGFLSIAMQVPQTKRTERAYHVGRILTLELSVEREDRT